MTTTENKTNAQRLYLTSWKYNAAHILTELETIVKNNGGALCRTWEYGNPPTWLTERKQFLISNRTITGAIEEEKKWINRFERIGQDEAAAEHRKKLEEYESIKNDPVPSYYGDYLYINFVVDGYYYSFSMDDNPFFDFHFAKIKVEAKNKINRNYYINTDSKTWWNDCFWRANCSPADRREAANLIYNMLLTSDTCRIYRDKNRKPYTNIVFLEDQK